MTEETAVLLKKKRTALRTAVTRVIQQIEKELETEKQDDGDVEELLEQLKDKFQALEAVDILCEPLFKSSEIDRELETVEQYREKIITWRFRANKHLRKSKEHNLSCNSVPIAEAVKLTETVNIKLPKINIPKFYGEIDQWLSFFNSFESAIHKNSSLHSIDKFTYLKGLLGSEALATVEGFAITADNYEKALELLKDRFGRKDAIINSHMQKLLNATPLKRSNDIKGLRQYFDMCQTQIRSLESLGVPSESFSCLLCPMILNCLPHDLIFEFNKETDGSEYKLENLLQFLNKQISARERTAYALAGQSFTQHSRILPRIRNPSPLYLENERVKFDTPRNSPDKNSFEHTAANFIATSGRERVTDFCVFCGSPHPTSKCPSAEEKTLNERKDILIAKGACFRCFRVCKHLARNCPANLNPCSFCGKMHHEILCFSREKLKRENRKKIASDNTVLSNCSCSKEVYLQTLIVRIKGKKSDHSIRTILDSGSQKSYISKFVVEKMKLNCVGEETTLHGLFGGIQKTEKHKKYVVTLSDVLNSYSCSVDVLDQKMICRPISKLRDSTLLKEIKEEGIFVSDTAMNANCCLYESVPEEIHMLLGADVIGSLLKGDIRRLKGGLVAVNTHLGWTVMGQMEETEKEKTSNVLLSLHVSSNCDRDLLDLDSMSIEDPCRRKTGVEVEEAAKEHDLRNVSGEVEGSLPWIQDHPPRSNGKSLAERKLRNHSRSLERTGNLENYETVLHSWLDEVNIEEDKEDIDMKSGQYLPHHPVYKEDSTIKIRTVFDGLAKEENPSSINECIEKGPNRIKLHEDDRPFLRFLWWEDDDQEKTKIYQHQRVVLESLVAQELGATLEHHMKQATGDLRITEQMDTELSLSIPRKFERWKQIAGIFNPADLPSRGCSADELIESLWWEGSGWQKTRLCKRDILRGETSEFEFQ